MDPRDSCDRQSPCDAQEHRLCEVCGAAVRELRRGRCWGCYSRWVEARPVGLGASCRLCGERRRSHMRSVELLGAWATVCHNCGARAAALDPMPQTLGGIRRTLARERRVGQIRPGDRMGPAASRRATDRSDPRTGGRGLAVGTGVGEGAAVVDAPAPRADSMAQVDDDMIVEIAELVSDLDALAGELPSGGQAACAVVGEDGDISGGYTRILDRRE